MPYQDFDFDDDDDLDFDFDDEDEDFDDEDEDEDEEVMCAQCGEPVDNRGAICNGCMDDGFQKDALNVWAPDV